MAKCMSCMQDYEQQEYCPFCGAEAGLKAADIGQIPAETILNRRFIIGELINSDRIGFTYLAWDALLERKVVIKEWFPCALAQREENGLDVKGGMDAELWERLNQQFMEHARKLHKLQNIPALVPIYTFFRENNTSYYVMEFLEGRTVRGMLERENPLVPSEAEKLMEKIAQALEILHDNGIIHGNLSPDNIFLCRTGEIRFLNLAWFSEEMKTIRYTVFQGKYAPFDYEKAFFTQNREMDTYSFCAVYYRLITGCAPVSALQRIKKEKLPSVSDYGVKISARTEKEIMEGLKNPDRSGKGMLRFLQILNVVLVITAAALGVLIVI
ncbi:MAG: protein kinase [Eubacteriales bacterium]|nr:protein kinase [Eubacteriales bacterium]